MSTKPATLPRWATDLTNNTAPSSGQQDTGWTPGQDGVSDYDNWAKYWSYKWFEWLNDGDIEFHNLSVSGETVYTGQATKTLSASTTYQNLDVLGGGDNLDGVYMVYITGASEARIGGLAGGVDGKEIIIVPTPGTDFYLNHEDTGSTAANRIQYAEGGFTNDLLVTGGSVTGLIVSLGSPVRLRYIGGTLNRWVVVSFGGGNLLGSHCQVAYFNGALARPTTLATWGTNPADNGWLVPATTDPLLYHINIPREFTILRWELDVQKNTNSAATVTARLFRCSGAAAATGLGSAQTNNDDAPGTVITLAETMGTVNTSTALSNSGDQYYVKFTPSNSATPSGDRALQLRVYYV
jgi:hypothetical protein